MLKVNDDVTVEGDSCDSSDEDDERFMIEGRRMMRPNRIGGTENESQDEFGNRTSSDISSNNRLTFSTVRGPPAGGSGNSAAGHSQE